jgi:hypothetical protein
VTHKNVFNTTIDFKVKSKSYTLRAIRYGRIADLFEKYKTAGQIEEGKAAYEMRMFMTVNLKGD